MYDVRMEKSSRVSCVRMTSGIQNMERSLQRAARPGVLDGGPAVVTAGEFLSPVHIFSTVDSCDCNATNMLCMAYRMHALPKQSNHLVFGSGCHVVTT